MYRALPAVLHRHEPPTPVRSHKAGGSLTSCPLLETIRSRSPWARDLSRRLTRYATRVIAAMNLVWFTIDPRARICAP
jgi:hypothetical protein